MEWFVYLIGGIALGAAILAIYERRKGRKMRHDAPPHDARLTDRGAHTKADQIRAEGAALQNPSSGYY